MSKVYTATAEDSTSGKIYDVAVFAASGWKHAEQIAEGQHAIEEADTFRIHRHMKGSTLFECDSCDGVGLMEGWDRRDGFPCPKCKGAGVTVIEGPGAVHE